MLQTAAEFPNTLLRGGKRSAFACPGLFGGSRGTGPLDLAAASRPEGRVGVGGADLPGDDSSNAEKNELKPGWKECWVMAPEAKAEFVAAMEEVLEVYQRPYDPHYPLVC